MTINIHIVILSSCNIYELTDATLMTLNFKLLKTVLQMQWFKYIIVQ